MFSPIKENKNNKYKCSNHVVYENLHETSKNLLSDAIVFVYLYEGIWRKLDIGPEFCGQIPKNKQSMVPPNSHF